MDKSKLLSIRDLATYLFTASGIVKAVDGVNLEIGERERVGLIGESGCGKTMTARSIMRLVPSPGKIIGGKIFFKGKNLLELAENDMRRIRGKEITMIFQDPLTYLNPVMRIKDQIAESISLHQRKNKAEIHEKVIELLKMVNIHSAEKVAENYPHQLSGGMRQRVIISMAIAGEPSLIITDEPTTALDATTQIQILDLIKGLVERTKASLLLITHDLGIVAETCDKIYIMYAGKILESGDVFTIFEDPKHPYTKGLLNAVLSIDKFQKTLITIEGSVPNPWNMPSGCRFHPRCIEARAICSKQEPPFAKFDSAHAVSCWLYA